jgi:chorismate dehydratase
LFEVILCEINRNKLERKIRVAAVKYLNTKPLIYGFEQGMMKEEIELITEIPSGIADMLINDDVDLALVPVATIPLLKEYHIISDFCIGCNGEVASVCLFSDSPIEEIETILLDYQSRSSVGLLKILLKEYWKISPKLINGEENYEEKIVDTTAGLVIGDRAFIQRKKSKYIYDLGIAWKELTGLPFLFAAWIANKKLEETFITNFNKANTEGFKHLPEIIEANNFKEYSLEKYYKENISYDLNADKLSALELYLQKLAVL